MVFDPPTSQHFLHLELEVVLTPVRPARPGTWPTIQRCFLGGEGLPVSTRGLAGTAGEQGDSMAMGESYQTALPDGSRVCASPPGHLAHLFLVAVSLGHFQELCLSGPCGPQAPGRGRPLRLCLTEHSASVPESVAFSWKYYSVIIFIKICAGAAVLLLTPAQVFFSSG